MKGKIISLALTVLALIAIIGLAACATTTSPTTTPAPSPSPTPTQTPSPSPSPTPAPTPSPSPSPTPSPTPAPTPSPLPSPSPTPTPSPTTSPSPGQSVTIDLVAKNIAFDKNTITVPAGAEVTVNCDNQDSGIPHNFAVYTDQSAATSIFVGQVITGPAKITYKFTAPATPGNYFFRCDIHPTIMTGTFVVQ